MGGTGEKPKGLPNAAPDDGIRSAYHAEWKHDAAQAERRFQHNTADRLGATVCLLGMEIDNRTFGGAHAICPNQLKLIRNRTLGRRRSRLKRYAVVPMTIRWRRSQ